MQACELHEAKKASQCSIATYDEPVRRFSSGRSIGPDEPLNILPVFGRTPPNRAIFLQHLRVTRSIFGLLKDTFEVSH
jgi:hypothetical protein